MFLLPPLNLQPAAWIVRGVYHSYCSMPIGGRGAENEFSVLSAGALQDGEIGLLFLPVYGMIYKHRVAFDTDGLQAFDHLKIGLYRFWVMYSYIDRKHGWQQLIMPVFFDCL